MNGNMEIYEKLRHVPTEAQKAIEAGRLKGMTDINPMWRIKALTELFGPCGVGWNLINQSMQLIPVDSTGEIMCIYEVDLVYKVDGEWSAPVHGIGGNKIAVKESKGMYADDEGVKKAYTDAIGSACKMIGCAADIYWSKDTTKYAPRRAEADITPMPTVGPVHRWTASDDIKAFCEAMNIESTAFAAYRKAAIMSNLVPDIPSKELTKGQCADLLAAIKTTLGVA